MVWINEATPPRIPGAPRAARRGGGRHMAEPLSLGQGPRPTSREPRLPPYRQRASRPDQMGQTCLPLAHPRLLDAIPLADQEALPRVKKGGKRLFGAMRMHHIEGDGVTGHHPPPGEGMRAIPGGCIDRVDRCPAGLLGYRRLVGGQRLRHPVAHLLHGAQAQGSLENRGTKRLDGPPTRPVGPGTFPHQGGQARAIARDMLGGEWRCAPLLAVRTPSLLPHQMCDVHLDGRPLDHLMRGIGRGVSPLGMTAGTRGRHNHVEVRRWQEALPMARLPGLSPHLPRGSGRGRRLWGGLLGRFPSLLVGRVGRRRAMRGAGILLETCCKHCDTLG